MHVLLTRSLFVSDMPHRLLLALLDETDFISFANLMAYRNEASIWASSAPIAARNTARSQYNPERIWYSSYSSVNASSSFIVSSAWSTICKVQSFSLKK